MLEILDKARNAKVIVVGDVMLDRYWWGDVTRISPEAPVPVVRLTRSTTALGGAANVAANISGLGGTPLLVGCIGSDPEGSSIPGLCGETGISSEHLVTFSERPTTVKTRIVAHSQQVARVDQETMAVLTREQESAVISAVERLIPESAAVAFSDYSKGVLSPRVLSSIIRQCRDTGIPAIVDPKGRDYSKYRGASLITPNRREAAEAVNIESDGKTATETAGGRLLNEFDFQAVLITEGEEGMTLFSKEAEPSHLPATAREVYDVTGAGDTVVAAMSLALATKSDLRSAAHLANAAAGLAVEHVGTTVVTADMLRTFLSAHELHAR
jgi:D-beta-D-heptose 7-phosphate kinase/D-beta-D-heptose 1-phosphate adenosyltransferase